MSKKNLLFQMVLIMVLFSGSSVLGDKNKTVQSMIERSYKNNTLSTANKLINQRKADEAISLLKNYRGSVAEEFDIKFLLSEARLEKCIQMLEVNNMSDPTYKQAIFIPFNMGKQIITNYRYDNKKLAHGQYICAKSFLLNDRPGKAERYLGYAMDRCQPPDINFYILNADILAENCFQSFMTKSKDEYPPNLSTSIDSISQYNETIDAYQNVLNTTKNNLIKGRLNYKIGVFELNILKKRKNFTSISESEDEHFTRIQKYFKTAIKTADQRTKSLSYYYLGTIQNQQGSKEMAQKSFSSALKIATDASLKEMIQKKIN